MIRRIEAEIDALKEDDDGDLEGLYTWIAELRDARDEQIAANAGLDGLLFLFGITLRRPAPRFTHTVTQISRMLLTEDKRAIRPLLVAHSLPVGRLRPSVSSALARLLMSIEKGDSLDMLGPSRWRLYRILEEQNPNTNPGLLVGVLHALETSGTDEDMWAIQTWAFTRYNTNAEQAIALATQRCMEAIREREDTTLEKNRLLRSTADQKEPLDLLRSTAVSPFHEPDKLVRSASLSTVHAGSNSLSDSVDLRG